MLMYSMLNTTTTTTTTNNNNNSNDKSFRRPSGPPVLCFDITY